MNPCPSRLGKFECKLEHGHAGSHVAKSAAHVPGETRWANEEEVRAFFAKSGERARSFADAFDASMKS